jgi:3-(3-hydroxy-phenyl)propionate hydroxylase
METIGSFSFTDHPPRLPELDDGAEPARHKVVIAGGGPVGLAVALALARWGVASVVLESDTTVCVGSRAICVSRRSLEILEQIDALPGFLEKGLAWEGGRTFHRLDEILHFRMPHDVDQKLPPMINLQQYWIEQFLVEAVERQAGLIEIRWGTELTGVEQRADGVALQASCAGTDYRLDCDWLVACDGGQSFVRRSLGLRLEGAAFEGKYVIVDIELPSRHPAERRAWFDPPSNPGSTVLMHKQPDDVWRIDYQVPDDADLDEALQPPNVAAFVQRHLEMIGEAHLPWRVVWISAYRAGAMTLERYRHGRIVFAGNAAHALPIFGVRGLNSGFDDAFNLGWKLAAVVEGRAGSRLIDSYDSERRLAFDINAASAIQSTEFMAPPSRGFSLMREAALTLSHRHPGIARLANPRQTTAIGYEGSPLDARSDALPAGPRPGAPAPDARLRTSETNLHLSELLGAHWPALVFESSDGVPARLAATLERLQAGSHPFRAVFIGTATASVGADASKDPLPPTLTRCRDVDGRAAHRYGAQDGAVYLLRPDGHVAGRWRLRNDVPLAAVIDATLGSAGAVEAAGHG